MGGSSHLLYKMQEAADERPSYESLQSYKAQYVVAALTAIWVLRKLFATSSPKLLLPPAPPALPIIGHLHLLGAHPHVSFAKLAQKYGPLVSLRLGQRQFIVASSPETAKEFLKEQDSNFCSRPYTSGGAHLLYNRQDIGFQDYNANFRYLRRIFTVEFMSPRHLRANQQAREDEVASMLNSIYQKCNSQEDSMIELKAYLDVMMLNTISYMVLKERFAGDIDRSKEKQEEAEAFLGMIEENFKLHGLFVPGDFIPSLKWLDLQGCEARMKNLGKRLDAVVSRMVLEHRERRKRGPVLEHEVDMVHVLLEKQEGDDGHQISDDNVKAVLLDTFLAGTQTAVVAVEWVMTELVRNPRVMVKAQAELDQVVGRDRMVQESDVQSLPYLEAIVKESLRLHPPGPLLIAHESIDAAKAFGYDIPAKTGVFVNVWAIGRDSAVWKEPLVFDPERFAQGLVDVRGLDFELLPFGSGRRMCPAMPLAVTVAQFTAASLLHAFLWSLPDHMDPLDLDMAEAFGLTLPKALPLRAAVVPRLDPRLYPLRV